MNKILHFTPYFPPSSQAAAIRNEWFYKVLKEHRHDVTLWHQELVFFKLANNKQNAIIRLVKETLLGIELFIRILFTSKFDTILFSSPPYVSILIASFAARLKKTPYILDIRDLYPEVFFEMNLISPKKIPGLILTRLTKSFYQYSKHVLTVTEGLKNEIHIHYQIPVHKIHLVRNGYDPDLFYPPRSDEKFPEFTLIFHGTLGKAQNTQTLVKLAQKLQTQSDIKIIVAGDGPKLSELKQPHLKNIHLLGAIDFKEIPKLIRKCHVGISFRTDDKIGKEAFPVKIFEYIGCALPVIITPKGEAGEIIKNLNLGQEFENHEVDQMLSYVLDLKNHYQPTQNQFLQFTRRAQAEKLLDLI